MNNNNFPRAGIPRGLPDSFLEKYLDWESKLENYGLTEEIINATAKLSIDELLICLCENSNKWMPTLHCELDWLALIELSKRELSDSDLERVKSALERRRRFIQDTRHKVVRTIKDSKRLKELLEKIC